MINTAMAVAPDYSDHRGVGLITQNHALFLNFTLVRIQLSDFYRRIHIVFEFA